MIKIIKLLLITFSLFFSTIATSKINGNWYVEFNNPTGVIARVDLGNRTNINLFMVIFEYQGRCDPLFSVVFFKGQSLGKVVSIDKVPPDRFFLTINGKRHSWYGAVANYEYATEISIGITKEAWSDLNQAPSVVYFNGGNTGNLVVPTQGLKDSLKTASQFCISRLR